MDVFITLLSLGMNGYKNLITQRKEMYTYLKEELTKVALKHGERLLETKNNPISLGNEYFNGKILNELLLCLFIMFKILILLQCSMYWRKNGNIMEQYSSYL
jgi:hypothetical protein